MWYERQLAGGSEIVIVNAADGRRRPPTDIERRAIEESGKNPGAAAAGIVTSARGDHGVSVRDGNLWLTDAAGAPVRALTTDGTGDAGYGIWPDNWQANYVPRLRSGKPAPPIQTQWAPNSRTILTPYIDQRNVAPYPFMESAPADGSFRPKTHLSDAARRAGATSRPLHRADRVSAVTVGPAIAPSTD